MLYGNSKRIVVVRDIPSNVIEEAIFILKADAIDESRGNSKKTVGKSKDKVTVPTDYLLKEAESIINSYITENKLLEKYSGKKIKTPVQLTKKQVNWILNGALVGSIALLIFVITRFI